MLWHKKIKAGFQDPQLGNREVIVEVPPIDILKSPNRFRTESILQALAITASELIRIEEERQQNFVKMTERLRGTTATGEKDGATK